MRANDGTIKLGHSVCPERRAKQLGVPVDIVHQTDVIELAEKVERLAHRILALYGKHLRGEWFEASLEDAIQAIEIATQQAEGEQLPLGGTCSGGRRERKYTDVALSIPLQNNLKERIQELAKADHRSVSAYIRLILEKHIENNH